MLKYTVIIDLDENVILSGYYNHFGVSSKKPSKKEISIWIGALATSDIEDAASHENTEKS